MTKTAATIRKALLIVLAISIVTGTLLLLSSSRFNTPNQFDLVQLDTGWTISRGNNVWELDSVNDASVGMANKNDTLILTRTLPDSDISPATLHFRSILSSVEVYVDKELVYTFGDEYVATGRMLPKMENFVPLPADYQGKELTIKITAHEDKAFSGLSQFLFGNYNDIKNNLIHTKRLPLVVGVYLCHLGFMLLILAPFLAFSKNSDFSIFFSAVTSLMIGAYILCYNDVFWYLSDNPYFYTFIEYFSLFSIPVAILGFICTSHQAPFKTLGLILLYLSSCFVVATSFLHLTSNVHICLFVSWFHVFTIIEGIYVIISLIKAVIHESGVAADLRTKTSSTKILIAGLIVFTFCSVIDIVKFNVMKFTKVGEVNAHINFMTVGALIFIMSLLLNYFYHCIEYISESTVKVQLEGLAYTDALTNLSNRARCEQYLADLYGDFTVISLDLDYLKYTNDNYGHDQGDKLLSGFSEIMLGCFTDASLVGRMGGDEFIVVLPYVDEERTERDIQCLSDQLAYRNSQESKLRFSASWGYADSKDKELGGNHSAQNVYLLADKRMYVMKNQHHKQSLGRLYDDLLNKVLGEGGNDEK
ncbi:diguanylate cyclase [Butyrivibrio sp. CB08]|uniref:sensor domain-containing diguanylate cyclase n=1 Tax=Butyrivibrio sp. CB08 TaxID=2364879 RepID=UPI000EA8D782|nr:GGDEF domain-containing protein [Butyrivibrio sp. CB08]RKM55949.1 diguanylate cyclase [Butyrivibrio sp. CB08]